MKISPKVWVPTAIAVLAGAGLYLLTGDKTALIVTLTGLSTGGVAALAPPAPRVKQSQVALMSRRAQR